MFRLSQFSTDYVDGYSKVNLPPEYIWENLSWAEVSGNPGATCLIRRNPERIDWGWLSKNPAAIHLLEKNPEKINWRLLAGNPAVVHFLKKIQRKFTGFGYK